MNKLISNLDNLLSDLVVDDVFFKSIKEFNYTWAYKNEEHMKFLGGSTIGEQVVTFSNKDDNVFYSILNTTYDEVKQAIYNISEIDKTRQVSSNPHYLFVMYLIYKAYNTNKLKDNIKKELVCELYYTFAYRVISGRMHHYFKYTLDKDIARTVVERLSNKFILKKLGNWNNLLKYRTKDILPNGLHYKTLQTLDINKTQKTVADLYTRLKDIFKNIYPIIIEVKNSNSVIKSTSLIESDAENEESFKENIVYTDSYVTYLKSIVNTPNDLSKDNLVRLVSKCVGVINPDELKMLLSNFNKLDYEMVNNLIEGIIPAVMDFLYRKGITSNYERNIIKIINLLKGYSTSHTVRTEGIVMARDILHDYITMVYGNKVKREFMFNGIAAIIVYLSVRPIYK